MFVLMCVGSLIVCQCRSSLREVCLWEVFTVRFNVSVCVSVRVVPCVSMDVYVGM